MTTSKVYLVGAGPGDPDLLTVKASRLLSEAPVVVYDRLVSPAVMARVPTTTRRIFVGKQTGHHHLAQDQINRLLVNLARMGQQVVRLKGGDPFVFGRGSEEAGYLAAHGVPFEVVPGVTAASAATAYAGIPLTHRGLARSVRLITGHCREDHPLELAWDTLADPDTTLVFYMGLANLTQLSAGLMGAGLAPDTPAALVERGTTARQRRIVTTLEALAERARSEAVAPPALVVIGRVVSLAGSLDWFTTGPDEAPEVGIHHALNA